MQGNILKQNISKVTGRLEEEKKAIEAKLRKLQEIKALIDSPESAELLIELLGEKNLASPKPVVQIEKSDHAVKKGMKVGKAVSTFLAKKNDGATLEQICDAIEDKIYTKASNKRLLVRQTLINFRKRDKIRFDENSKKYYSKVIHGIFD